MKAECFLVLEKRGNGFVIIKSSHRSTSLSSSQARIKVVVEVPDDIFEAPTVTVQAQPKEIEVAVLEPDDG